METLARTRKIGGSLVVTLPRILVEEKGLVENQLVKIDVQKVKKSGFGLFKNLGSFDRESKLTGQFE